MTRKEQDYGCDSPQIIFDKKILSGSLPYEIKVDKEKIYPALLKMGLKKEDLENLKIFIKQKPDTKHNPHERKDLYLYGEYYYDSNSIFIYTNNAWAEFNQHISLAKNISYRKRSYDVYQFGNILYTKRLDEYLENTPPERGFAFASRIIEKAISREINKTLLHEVKHATNIKNKTLVNILSGINLFYVNLFNSALDEYSAIEFERKNACNPEFTDLITFKLKLV